MDYLTRQLHVIPAGLEKTQYPGAKSPNVYKPVSFAAQETFDENQGWTHISSKKKKKTSKKRSTLITDEVNNEYQHRGGKTIGQLYLDQIYQLEQDIFKQRLKNKNRQNNKIRLYQ
jgi:hypothetical protein